MNKLLYFLVIFLFVGIGCSKQLSDEELLRADKKKLEKKLDSYTVKTYKFGKICIRGAASNDSENDSMAGVKESIDYVAEKLLNFGEGHDGNLSVFEYLKIYKIYKEMTEFVDETDEDDFPTLMEAFNISLADSMPNDIKFLEGEEKAQAQNIEHAVLGVLALTTRGMGRDIALYECSKTNPELLPEGELQALVRLLRAVLFFDGDLLYLSEKELSENINWLEENSNSQFQIVSEILELDSIQQNSVIATFTAINYLFRGLGRTQMERKIDNERALNDFDAFLEKANELGLSNELTYSVDAYVNLKRKDSEGAIEALNSLKTSDMLSNNEQKAIEEAIGFLQNRQPDKVLNGAFDKIFLGKLVLKYFYGRVAEVNWQKYFNQKEVPHIDKIFKAKSRFEDILSNVQSYSKIKSRKKEEK